MLKGFKEFLLRGNIVDLAIAVVIGAAFAGVVASLVADMLTPLIGALFGQPDFSALAFTINGSQFKYGHFANTVINFVFVATAIYFVVVVPMKKVMAVRAARVAAGAPADAEAVPSEELVVLREMRDALFSMNKGETRFVPRADAASRHQLT